MQNALGEGIFRGSGMLSDSDIRGAVDSGAIRIVLQEHAAGYGFDLDEQLQLNAIDLHAGPLFRRLRLPEGCESITLQVLRDKSCTELTECPPGQSQRLEPGEILLATTRETVVLNDELAGMVIGRSSVARMGIMVNCCAPLIKPGHASPVPLQLINLNPYPVDLNLDVALCQIVFFSLSTPATSEYADLEGAKYASEGSDPRSSLLYEDDESLVSTESEPAVPDSSGPARRQPVVILHDSMVREILWVFATFTVVEQVAEKVTASLGDAVAFLNGVPLNLILGIIVLVVLILTRGRNGR